MSMSIPYFYEPVILQYRDSAGKAQKSVIVDGGLLSNFPVWLFDSKGVPEWPTFGFKLVEPGSCAPAKIRGPLSMLRALFATMMEAHDARYIEDQNFARTVPIPTLGVGTVDFDLNRRRSGELFDAGYSSAQKFFEGWNFERYILAYRRDESRHGRNLAL